MQVTKHKDPKKVEAGKKGYQTKLLKLKEEILQEGSNPPSTLPSTLLSTSGSTSGTSGNTSGTNGTTSGSTSGSNLLSTSSIFLGGAGVLVVAFGVYFYTKPIPNRQAVQLINAEIETTTEEWRRSLL